MKGAEGVCEVLGIMSDCNGLTVLKAERLDQFFGVGLGDEAVFIEFIIVEKIYTIDSFFLGPVFGSVEDALVIIPNHTDDADHASSPSRCDSDSSELYFPSI